MSHESWVISLYLNRILFPLQLASRQQAIYSSQSQSVSQSPNIRRPEIEQSWPSLIIPQSSAAQPQWQSQSQASTWSDKSSAAPEKSRTLPSGLTLLGWLGLGWQCATGVGVGVTSLKEPLDFDFRFFIHRFKVFPGFGGVTTTSGDLQITCFFAITLTADALIGVKGPSTVCQLGVPPVDGEFINRLFNFCLNASELDVLEFEPGLTNTPSSETAVGLPGSQWPCATTCSTSRARSFHTFRPPFDLGGVS